MPSLLENDGALSEVGSKELCTCNSGMNGSGDVQQFFCVSYPFQQNVLAPMTKGLGAFVVK